VLKLWEISYQALNASVFFEKHQSEVESLGFSVADMESRRQYYQEIFTNPEIVIPTEYSVPEKPEEWIDFEIPQELVKKAATHEDKIMIGKWTFIKPELTFHHLKNIC